MALTELLIQKIGAKNLRFEVSDGNGLFLRVTPTGIKTWVFRYRFDGVLKRLTLGKYPVVGLTEARKQREIAIQQIANGIDPFVLKKQEKEGRVSTPFFGDLLNEFWDIELSKKKSGPATLHLIQKNVLPDWKHRKVVDLKRRDIVMILDKVKARGAEVLSNRVLGSLTRMFNFAAERGIIEDTPCSRIRKVKETPRDRVLTNAEIKLLWECFDIENKKIDIFRVVKLALKMILVTGQRPGEVSAMRYDEIENGFWVIPPEKTKNGQGNRVYLSPLALEIIEQARVISGDDGYIFTSSHKPGEPVLRSALGRAVIRHWKEMGFARPWTPHDLRRTLRTKMAEIGIQDVIAERILGHKLQGMLGVYNRYDYDNEKRQAMTRYDSELQEILGLKKFTGGNVIQLGARREAR